MPFQNFNDYEKERLRLKIEWEGGLRSYIDYGISKYLYDEFKNEFDEIFEIKRYTKRKNRLVNLLERKIGDFLTIENKDGLKDVDLNDYNYILDF